MRHLFTGLLALGLSLGLLSAFTTDATAQIRIEKALATETVQTSTMTPVNDYDYDRYDRDYRNDRRYRDNYDHRRYNHYDNDRRYDDRRHHRGWRHHRGGGGNCYYGR